MGSRCTTPSQRAREPSSSADCGVGRTRSGTGRLEAPVPHQPSGNRNGCGRGPTTNDAVLPTCRSEPCRPQRSPRCRWSSGPACSINVRHRDVLATRDKRRVMHLARTGPVPGVGGATRPDRRLPPQGATRLAVRKDPGTPRRGKSAGLLPVYPTACTLGTLSPNHGRRIRGISVSTLASSGCASFPPFVPVRTAGVFAAVAAGSWHPCEEGYLPGSATKGRDIPRRLVPMGSFAKWRLAWAPFPRKNVDRIVTCVQKNRVNGSRIR